MQVFLVLVITSIQQTCLAVHHRGRGSCATQIPNDSLKAEFRRLKNSDNDLAVDQGSRRVMEPIEIETWFHVVSSEASGDMVSDGMITTQVSPNTMYISY